MREDRAALLGFADGRLTHLRGLDGLRGLAVVGVVLFHGQWEWLRGGWLGVSLFFTLSGFLITSLLIVDYEEPGLVWIRDFWARRFRRLLPAAWVTVLAVVALTWAWGTPSMLRRLPGDVWASLAQVANWRFLFAGRSYGELFSAPSPLLHFWSLGIEEQVYLLFPVVVLVLARMMRRRGAFLAVFAAGAAASWAVPLVWSMSVDRVYYGTDTRAGEILAGAALAVVVSTPGVRRAMVERRAVRVGVAAAGGVALAATLCAWVVADRSGPFVARGGLVAASLASSVMILAAAVPTGPMRRLCDLSPLRWLGRVSYAVYLFHWPALVFLGVLRPGWAQWQRFVVAVAVTLVLAEVSRRLIESPIRERRGVLGLPGLRPSLVAPPLAALLVLAPLAGPERSVQAAGFDIDTAQAQLALMQRQAADRQPATPATLPPLPADTPTAAAPPAAAPPASAAPTPAAPASVQGVTTSRPPVRAVGTAPAPTAPATSSTVPWIPQLPVDPMVPKYSMFGDSVALSLALILAGWEQASGQLRGGEGSTELGCGVARYGYRRVNGVEPIRPFCDAWTTRWSAVLDRAGPQMALMMSAQWELVDRKLKGDSQWRAPGDPVYDAYVVREYLAATDVLASRGAVVVWLTVPYYGAAATAELGPGLQSSHDRARVDRLNQLIRQVVAARPGVAYLVDLAGWMADKVDDPSIRADGSHFAWTQQSPVAGQFLGPALVQIWREVWAAKRAQYDAAAGR